ncbi:hypothetical protein FA95DRAFT_1609772 [Auriscalpium vulgare]|uniref:Uncharacterized protein n=1 Tax=Auriscalpium vulgare TaxID=40419 RepID=A0ACB8RG14_9AGAM|nr:hypothetical protein FA95DRAFT_1609772 [Auriscalpium vulgare]
MPTRGDRHAPTFDGSRPRELPRYFAELKHLLTQAGITNDEEMKAHAVRYLNVLTADQWVIRPEFEKGKKFANFEKAIIALYLGADGEQKYVLGDLDRLVAQYANGGLTSLRDLSHYYREFYAISEFLKKRGRVLERDQDFTFLRGLPRSLQDRVEQRLQGIQARDRLGRT